MTNEPLPVDGASPPGPTFEEAVRSVVEGLRLSVAEFESLLAAVPESAYREAEWAIIEKTAADLETLVEQVELEYTMAAYDSEAWYEIMKDLPRVTRMLGDTMLLMREAQARQP